MLIGADGLAFYGTGSTSRTNMVLGPWAQIDSPIQCSTANPRPGAGTHHLRFSGVQADIVRRALGAHYNTLGMAGAFYFDSLPDHNNTCTLFQLRDGSNASQFTLTCSTTGVIQVRTGDQNGTVVAATTGPALTAGAYSHIEFLADISNSGAIEIRVNSVTVLDVTGVDLQGTGASGAEQFVIGNPENTGLNSTMDVADLDWWDTSGAVNNDFLGDVCWAPVVPSADTVVTAWTRNTGATDVSAITETTPDGDTTYIEATASGQVSEFTLPDAPANTSEIIAVVTQPMMRKTDAGTGSVKVSMLSSGSPAAEHEGAEIPLTTAYTYYPQVHETDPATGVRWTPSGYNASRIRFERSA